MADNKYPRLSEILAAFLKSGEIAPTQHGCIVSRNDLASEFYYRVYYHRKNLSASDSIFFADQLAQMDSVILYSDKDTRLVYTALNSNNANPKRYDRIKELADQKNNTSALIALAKYRKPGDIPFLIRNKGKSFLAISVFPDTAFWNFLLGYKSKEKSLNYFLAVTSYKNENALSVLNEIYKSCDSVQVNEIDEALIKNYCPLYQDLILKIWEDHKTIDLTITKQLIADCPEKASKAFANGLLSGPLFNWLQLDYRYGTADSILPLMLAIVSKNNNDLTPEICHRNITTSVFTDLEPFLNFIKENKMRLLTGSLLERLKQENQAFEIFHITETLLSFNDPETNKTLTQVLITNQKNWDWGNWSGHFRKTFQAYGIPIK